MISNFIILDNTEETRKATFIYKSKEENKQGILNENIKIVLKQ